MKYEVGTPIPKVVVREVVAPPVAVDGGGTEAEIEAQMRALGFERGSFFAVLEAEFEAAMRRATNQTEGFFWLGSADPWVRGWRAWGATLAARGWFRRHLCGLLCWAAPGVCHSPPPASAPPVIWRPMAMGRAFERERKARDG